MATEDEVSVILYEKNLTHLFAGFYDEVMSQGMWEVLGAGKDRKLDPLLELPEKKAVLLTPTF